MSQKIFKEIKNNLPSVISKDSELGKYLWEDLIKLHPADISQFLSDLNREEFRELYLTFPQELKIETFKYLSDVMKAHAFEFLPKDDKLAIIEKSPLHEMIDFFEFLSDEELKELFKLLHKKDRTQAVELMRFGPESAGGVMDTDIITLTKDLNVEQSIQILQRLQPKKEILQEIYVTDQQNKLAGHIRLEDLVLKKPLTHLHEFLKENEVVAAADEDQESVAQKMMHYHLTSIPVVGPNNLFLGVIPSDTLIEIIEDEASEDVYRISAMAPIKQTYFETPFMRLLSERSFILIILLLAESLSTTIMDSFELVLSGFFLSAFVPMLVSCGGNTSSQSSAIAIQGLGSGEINYSNVKKFLRRELLIAACLALILATTAFIRVYLTRHDIYTGLIVALTLASIVTLSVTLGSLLPLLLKRFKIDPAFSAGPFLATIMDVVGLLIYCYIAKLVLG
ncbi:MAG: magnesium transporter [Gammaproteobacteria bacterium RIFCSPHIGHO2_12_FULL_37_14]|nr:MAG: magnesium transporter [Gammaproteobacteria bacterium RIFCSPHIGHO2_12_FULL_37_14]